VVIALLCALSLVLTSAGAAGAASALSSSAPSGVSFAPQAAGTVSGVQQVTISNPDTVTHDIGQISDSLPQIFQLSQDTCSNTPILSGGQCTIDVAFAPQDALGYSDTLEVPTSDDGGELGIPLSGTGTGQSKVEFTGDPPSLSTAPGVPVPYTLTITDGGNASLDISSVGVTGAPDLGVTNDQCSGQAVAPGATCTVAYSYAPTSAETETASIVVQSNDPVQTDGDFTLALSAEPAAVSFGPAPHLEAAVGATTSGDVSITNAGDATLSIQNITLGGAASLSIDPSGNSCTGQSVAPGNSCSLQIDYSPLQPQTVTGTLKVTSNDPTSPDTLPLPAQGDASEGKVAPTSIAFGKQAALTQTQKTVTISNIGVNTPLDLQTLGVSGDPDFSIDPSSTCSTSAPIPAGSSCQLVVDYTPTTSGAGSATLNIADDATYGGQTAQVTLSGTGTGAPALSFTGGLTTISTSPGNPVGDDITVTDSGNLPLVLGQLSLTGSPSIVITTDGCSGQTIAAGASCDVLLTYAPAVPGAGSTKLKVPSNAATSPDTFSVSASAPASEGTVAPSTLAFGKQAALSSSAAKTVTVTNGGYQTALDFSSIGISGDPAFTIDPATTTCAVGTPVPAGGSCQIGVIFSPVSAGATTASLNVSDDATFGPSSAQVGLSGTGTGAPALSFTGGSPTLSTTPGNPVGDDVVVSDTGNLPLVVGTVSLSAGSDFSIALDNCSGVSVAPGGSCDVELSYAPVGPDTQSATLKVPSNAATSPDSFAISGTSAASQAKVAPATLAFGKQAGQTTTQKTVTVSNTGVQTALDLRTLGISGDQDFSIDPTSTCSNSTPVAAGASCQVVVDFTPSTGGAGTATLNVSDDATFGSQSAQVALSGTGTGAPAVTLNGGGALTTVPGTPVSESIKLTNTGNLPLVVGTVAVSGDASFSVAASGPNNRCTGQTITAGGQCSMQVTYSPTAPGTDSATLKVPSNAASSPDTLSLSGTANASEAQVAPATLAFGNQAVLSTSAPKTVTITNVGYGTSLKITSVAVSGTSMFAKGSDGCTGETLSVGGKCTVTVTFSPTAAGAQSGQLTVSDDATFGGGSQQVALSGTGTGAPAVQIGGANLLSTTPGNPVSEQVSVTDAGNLPLVIGTVSISGASTFTIAAAGANNTCTGQTLAAGASCDVRVTYSPTAPGTASATLKVPSNAASSPDTVGINGASNAAAASLSTTSISFGSVAGQSTSTTKKVTITNSGSGVNLNISAVTVSGDDEFSITNDTCLGGSVAPAGTCSISLVFKPITGGAHSATLSITDNATFGSASPQTVALSGTGTGQSGVGLTGSHAITTTPGNSATDVITITNSGNLPLTIGTITMGGAGDLNVASAGANNTCSGSTVAAGATCTVQVSYAPTQPETVSGTMQVPSNAPSSPNTYAITGTADASVASVSPGSINFGDVPSGQTAPAQTVTVANTGVGIGLKVTSVKITGDSSYTIGSNTCTGATVGAGGQCQLSVTFTSGAAGSHDATLSITDDPTFGASSPQQVILSGTTTVPNITVPQVPTFPNTVAGQTSAGQGITVKNSGSAPLKITSVTIGGANFKNFVLNSQNCTGGSIAAGASCNVNVSFMPTTTGLRTGAVILKANISGGSYDIAVSGTGLPPADLANVSGQSGCNQIVIDWTPSTATGFLKTVIVRNANHMPDSPTDGTVFSPTTTGQFVNSGLPSLTTYDYKVFAEYEFVSGVTAYSSGVGLSLHTGWICAPLNMGTTSSTKPTVSWLAYPNAVGYSIVVYRGSTSVFTGFSTGTSEQVTTALSSGVTYQIRLYGYTKAKPNGFLMGTSTFTEN
jgi:uncharacterized membrane protein